MAMPLPSLNSLLTFEKAGSQCSFSRAARELGVSREAVSMQVRQLERVLGYELFTRQRRGVELTTAGRTLHEAVSSAFRDIAGCIETLGGRETTIVTISTSVAFAGCWLLPRLLEFQRLHPDINIEMIETDECLDLRKSNVDFAIRYGKGKWKDHASSLLFEDCFFPVCSPSYLAEVGPARIHNFDDVTIFHLAGAEHAWEDWQTWFELSGRRNPIKARGIWMQSFENILRATVGNKGIALGWTHLVERELLSGKLVCPFDEKISTGNGYYVVLPAKDAPEKPATVILRRWITDSARLFLPVQEGIRE